MKTCSPGYTQSVCIPCCNEAPILNEIDGWKEFHYVLRERGGEVAGLKSRHSFKDESDRFNFLRALVRSGKIHSLSLPVLKKSFSTMFCLCIFDIPPDN